MESQSELFNIEERKFSISYDADDPALSAHRMDAETLASTINSVALLIKQADDILNGENRNIKVLVSAPAKEGSLVIEFIALMISPDIALTILKSLGLITPVGGIIYGVFDALRDIKDKEIINVHTSDDSDKAIIKLANDEEIEVERDVGLLITSPQIRKQVKQIVSTPLADRDKASFKILSDSDDVSIEFRDDDIQAIKELKTNAISQKTTKITINTPFSQVNFKGKTGWKIQAGDGMIVSASMEDEDFLNLIRVNQQSFKKEDSFRIVLEITTTNDVGKEYNKYKILRVLPPSN
mgnify:CR=1 FL=1